MLQIGWSESASIKETQEVDFAVVMTAKCKNMPLAYSLLYEKKDG